MSVDQQVIQWGQIVTKAWQDEEFKKRLLTEPAAVLKEFGLEVPTGVQLHVVENTDRIVYLTLPAKPQERELSEEELAGVAGGLAMAEFALLLPLIAVAMLFDTTPPPKKRT